MNGLIIKVLSISIAVVTVVYLIIYKGNTMITKIFSVCIIAAMVIYWIVYERNTRKRKKQELQRDDYLFAKENDLPLNINWKEINDFLLDSEYGVNMPMEKWFMLDTKYAGLSEKVRKNIYDQFVKIYERKIKIQISAL